MVESTRADVDERRVGRYLLRAEIAKGGMATVHLGMLVGPLGFSRVVAIKRLHRHLASDPDFVTMFVDEARLAGCVRHPNVVSIIDVVVAEDEVLLVMDYVHGQSLSKLVRGRVTNPRIVASVSAAMLHGLHAAHEAKDQRGVPLKIVHRDVSPQNVVVGVDGIARVLDFGVAKAAMRAQATSAGRLKGKLAYMAPEQLEWRTVDARTDVFAAAVVTWEMLTGRALFAGGTPEEMVARVRAGNIEPPSRLAECPPELDAIVMRGLALAPEKRFPSAGEMADAIEKAVSPAGPSEVGSWVETLATETLEQRSGLIRELETHTAVTAIESAPSTVIERFAGIDGGGDVAELAVAGPTTAAGSSASHGADPTAPSSTVVADANAPPRPSLSTLVSPAAKEAETVTAGGSPRSRNAPDLRAWWAWLLVGGAALGLAVLAGHGRAPSPGTASSGVPAVASTAPTGSPPRTVEMTAPLPEAQSPVSAPTIRERPLGARSAAAATVSGASASPPAHGAPAPPPPSSATTATPAASPAPPSGAAAPRPGCDPPGYYDAQGVWRFYRHCL